MSSFTRRLIIWFVLTCTILSCLCFATYRSIEGLLKQNGWVDHTYEVLMLLDETVINLKEVQTATRGYVLIGQPRFADMSHRGATDTRLTLDHLETILADNPEQLTRMPKLRAGAESVIDFANQTITLLETKGQKEAVAWVATGVGQQRIDATQEIIEAIRATETELLTARRAHVQQAVTITFTICVFGLLCCFGIMGLVFWLIDRETRRRTAIEQSLQNVVRDMEVITHERTQIAQMGDFLQSCRTPLETHTLIKQNMPKLFPGTHGGLGVISNSRNMINIAVQWGAEDSTMVQFPPEDCWGMRRGKAHAVGAGSPDPDCQHLSARMPDYTCLPLVAHGETLGMLYIASTDTDYFTARRQLLLRTICEQISLALANMKLQETLRMQSLRDPLTHLYNRRYMESSLERELLRSRRNTQPLSVLMIDVDHFKRFNDTSGHDAGDALLKEFAQLLQRNVRGEDIACRYGGEEFMLILPTCPPHIAEQRATKIVQEAKGLEIEHHGAMLPTITVSIGIAHYPQHAQEVESLIKAADRALYQSKANGRDQWTMALAS